MQAIRS